VITDAILDLIQSLAEAVIGLFPRGWGDSIPDMTGIGGSGQAFYAYLCNWLPMSVLGYGALFLFNLHVLIAGWNFVTWVAEKVRLLG
jgi:hypothetical protein